MKMDMQNLKEYKKLLIEVNQKCNLNCTYCFYRDYGRVDNNLNVLKLKEALQECVNVDDFYLTGGECFISPNIEEIINYLFNKGKITIFTNGIVLNEYSRERFENVINKVDNFIISFDSFDFSNYVCRRKLDSTIETIKKIIKYDDEKVEVKVCITNFNYEELHQIFQELINIGVKKLSINFIFDITNSTYEHEIRDIQKLKEIFEIIDKYKKYFNMKYINTLYDLYINGNINEKYPCIAGTDYLYLDCTGKYFICPGNTKNIGSKYDWKKCYTKECANEWEIMYERGEEK